MHTLSLLPNTKLQLSRLSLFLRPVSMQILIAHSDDTRRWCIHSSIAWTTSLALVADKFGWSALNYCNCLWDNLDSWRVWCLMDWRTHLSIVLRTTADNVAFKAWTRIFQWLLFACFNNCLHVVCALIESVMVLLPISLLLRDLLIELLLQINEHMGRDALIVWHINLLK